MVQSACDKIRRMRVPGVNEVMESDITKTPRNQALIKTRFHIHEQADTNTTLLSHIHQHMQAVGRLMWVLISKSIPPSPWIHTALLSTMRGDARSVRSKVTPSVRRPHGNLSLLGRCCHNYIKSHLTHLKLHLFIHISSLSILIAQHFLS